jgi:hypothetical protein
MGNSGVKELSVIIKLQEVVYIPENIIMKKVEDVLW